jgi:hypothetical protein
MNKTYDISSKLEDVIKAQTNQPDEKTQADISFLEIQKLNVEIENYKQNTGERKLYAKLIYRFTCLWCLCVGILLVACGLSILHLSDTVLTTILGCTTLNVFGFFYLVTQYLFNKKKST